MLVASILYFVMVRNAQTMTRIEAKDENNGNNLIIHGFSKDPKGCLEGGNEGEREEVRNKGVFLVTTKIAFVAIERVYSMNIYS